MESPPSHPDSPMDQDDVPFPCKGCGEILEEGKAFELAGNRWHIECFCCSTCGTLLDSDAHLLLLGDGSLICSNCTYSCSSCGNKIEDLAILTGEQAFCAQCFRCRNCKRKIENLRYARTSQGIFCMDCHESLMQRRRKRNRGVASSRKQASANIKLDKSLPSLPPEDADHLARPTDDPTADAYADATTEVASRGAAPALDAGRSGLHSNNNQDNLILPSSTYRSNRHSLVVPRESEADTGGEFLIPVAFDPSEEHDHSHTKSPSSAHKSPRDGSDSLPSDTSPHIAYQEKGRDIANGSSARSSRSDLPSATQKETSSFSTPSPESTRSSTTLQRDPSTLDRTSTVESSTTVPTRPSHELRRLHENTGSVDSARSFLSSSSLPHHPKRGDSLESKLHQIPRKETGVSPRPNEQWHDRSKSTTKVGESPRTPRTEADYTRPARPNSITTGRH